MWTATRRVTTRDPRHLLAQGPTQTSRRLDRDRIQREMGNILYDDYAYVNLFYMPIEFVANPDIIDQWPFPGSDGADYGHFDLITACTTPDPCK